MSSVLQILYKNESGSLAKVVTVVANTVPPTFSLTHEAKEAKGGFDSVPFVFSAELAMILSSKLLEKCTKRCFENQFEYRFFLFLKESWQICNRLLDGLQQSKLFSTNFKMRDSVTLYEFLKKVSYLVEKRQLIFELIAIVKWIWIINNH